MSIGTRCPTATIGADACPRAACAPRGGDPWEVSAPRRTSANAMTAMLSTALAMTHHCGFRISLAPDVCAAPDGLLHWDAAVGPGQRNASQRHIAAVQGFQIVAVHPMQPDPERLRTLVETVVQLHDGLNQGPQAFRIWLHRMNGDDLEALHRGYVALARIALAGTNGGVPMEEPVRRGAHVRSQ